MLGHLIESVPQGSHAWKNLPSATLSLVVHGALLGGAVLATIHAGPALANRTRDLGIVYFVQDFPTKATPVAPLIAPGGLTRLQIPFPTTIPLTLPDIDSSVAWDPSVFDRNRLGPDLSALIAGPTPADSARAVAERDVDEKPEQISTFTPEYPDLLRQAGIEGSVVIEVIVDTSGSTEPASLRVVRSTHRAFEAAARDAVLRSRYRAGRVRGHPVRVVVQVPITFTIRR